jgi:hypothetical protein
MPTTAEPDAGCVFAPLLRSIAADIKNDPNHAEETISAGIPSLPGLQLMEFAERRLRSRPLARQTMEISDWITGSNR